jgi:hypothetical protein
VRCRGEAVRICRVNSRSASRRFADSTHFTTSVDGWLARREGRETEQEYALCETRLGRCGGVWTHAPVSFMLDPVSLDPTPRHRQMCAIRVRKTHCFSGQPIMCACGGDWWPPEAFDSNRVPCFCSNGIRSGIEVHGMNGRN